MKPVNISELLARIDAHLRTKNFYTDLAKEDLLMLLELTELISVTRNPRKILNIIVEKMVQAIDVTRCSIMSITEEGDLIVKVSSDLAEGEEITLDLHKYPEIQKAMTTQRPVVLQDIGSDPLMNSVKESVRNISDNAIFVVPIIKKQNVIGTFFLRTSSHLKEGITDRIYKLCQVVANISGNALENAILFESLRTSKRFLEDLSIRDGLTQLYNHQHYHARFCEEFSRAQRYGANLSCIFIDVDDFKLINDRHGHVIGDAVLKQIAGLIKNNLRKSDIAARYGGEEFAILLPNTDSKGAMLFADRILRMIRNISLKKLQSDRITASLGVATYADNSIRDYEELLSLADQAMYQAKNSGKNRVCRAEVLPASGQSHPQPCSPCVPQ